MDVAEQMIKAARTLAEDVRPYFAHGLYGMILLPAPQVPRMACDQWYRVYYNPDWVVTRSVPDLTIGLYHELWHLLREHHVSARFYGVTKETWHLAVRAMDYPINFDLLEDMRPYLKDKHAKDVQKALANAPLFNEIVYAKEIGLEDGSLWTYYYEYLLAHPPPTLSIGFGQCGSGATGVPMPWDVGSPTDSGVEGLDEADRRDIQKLVANAIRKNAARGTTPGSYSDWADSVILPKPIPWDDSLDAAMHGGCDTTWGHVLPVYTRLSRRSCSFPDTVLPAMRRPRPIVVMVGDTSGSMDTDRLLLVRGTAEDLARAAGARVAFVATDAEVHGEVQYIDEAGDAAIEMRGRGGTDMCVGIAWVMEHVRPTPNVIMVATDGDTPWPEEEIDGVSVIALIIDNPGAKSPPSWITRIDVMPEAA